MTLVAIALISFPSAAAAPPNRDTILQDYAYMVADVSVAQRRCDFQADWKAVAAEGRARDINENDISQLDRLVSDRTAIIETSLSDDAAVGEWCKDALLGYGPDGLEARGLLKP